MTKLKNQNEELVCLGIDIAGTDTVPEVVPLFAYGRTDYTNADNESDHYEFLEADADMIIGEFKRRGVDGMIDYNHQQLRAKTNGQPAPASGWITALEKAPEGLNARVAWTDPARKYIENKEYRYTSPLFVKDTATNRIKRYINLALTNIPGTDRQQALVSLELDIAPDLITLGNKPGKTNGGNMPKEKLFQLVGLEMPEAEDQQLVALETAISGLVADKTRLTDEVTGLEEELQGIKQQEETTALEAAINDGLAKGKINNVGAEKLRGKSSAEVLTILEMIPENSAVPLNRAPEGNGQETVALSAEDIAYCKKHGYNQEEFAKSQKK